MQALSIVVLCHTLYYSLILSCHTKWRVRVLSAVNSVQILQGIPGTPPPYARFTKAFERAQTSLTTSFLFFVNTFLVHVLYAFSSYMGPSSRDQETPILRTPQTKWNCFTPAFGRLTMNPLCTCTVTAGLGLNLMMIELGTCSRRSRLNYIYT